MNGRIITALLVLFMAALIAFFSFDSKLNPEIEAVFDQNNSEPTLKNNGSIYLLGMWTDSGKSPYSIGLDIIYDYQKKLKTAPNQIPVLGNFYHSLKWLQPDEENYSLWCDFSEESCLDRVWAESEKVKLFLDSNAVYLERLEGLMEYESFSLFLEPNMGLPRARFESIGFAMQLKLQQIIHLTSQENYQDASRELESVMRLNINMIEKTPDVLTKVLALVFQRESVEVASYLLSKTPIGSTEVWQVVDAEISNFSYTAASNKNIFLNKFLRVANSLIGDNYDLTSEMAIDHGFIPKSLVYKPNKTLNLLYKMFNERIDVYRWVDDRIVRVKPKLDGPNNVPYQWTNVIGSMFVQTVVPRFSHIEVDSLELYFRHIAFNEIYRNRLGNSINLEDLDVVSPYSGDKAFNIENKVCVDGETKSDEPICLYL